MEHRLRRLLTAQAVIQTVSERDLDLTITSPPDRERLVAEIWIERIERIQLAEVNMEEGKPIVEIYPRPDNAAWTIDARQLVDVLNRAIKDMEGRYS